MCANRPAARKAGITRPLTIQHRRPGLPEPGRQPFGWHKMDRKQYIWRMSIVVLIGLGGFLILPLVNFVSISIYNHVALQIAFGPDRPARDHITVQHITKPSTVTFSNGERIDVGNGPATAGSLFFLAVGIPLLVCYIVLICRYSPQWFREGVLEHFRKQKYKSHNA